MITGYKIFGPGFKCMGFQYQVGKPALLGPTEFLSLGRTGFHFCRKAAECLEYTEITKDCRFAQVTAVGKVQEHNTQCATDKLLVTQELTEDQFRELCTDKVQNSFGETLTYWRGWLHSFEDQPSRVSKDGTMQEWHKLGKLHRDKGPALVYRTFYGLIAKWCQDGNTLRALEMYASAVVMLQILDKAVKWTADWSQPPSWSVSGSTEVIGAQIIDLTEHLNGASKADRYREFARDLFEKWITL